MSVGLPHLSATQWSAVASWVTVLAAITAGIVAWRQLREARRLRREQAQPYVAVSLEPSDASPRLVDLVIKNYGATAALNVSVTMTPAPRRTGDDAEVAPYLLPESLPTLVPGQTWRSFWDSMNVRMESELPDRHEVEVRFSDSSGDAHTLAYVLDWRQEIGRGFVVVHTLHDMAKSVKDLADDVHKWRRGHGGIEVWARDGDARVARETKGMERRRRLRNRQEGNAPPGVTHRVADWWHAAVEAFSSR